VEERRGLAYHIKRIHGGLRGFDGTNISGKISGGKKKKSRKDWVLRERR